MENIEFNSKNIHLFIGDYIFRNALEKDGFTANKAMTSFKKVVDDTEFNIKIMNQGSFIFSYYVHIYISIRYKSFENQMKSFYPKFTFIKHEYPKWNIVSDPFASTGFVTRKWDDSEYEIKSPKNAMDFARVFAFLYNDKISSVLQKLQKEDNVLEYTFEYSDDQRNENDLKKPFKFKDEYRALFWNMKYSNVPINKYMEEYLDRISKGYRDDGLSVDQVKDIIRRRLLDAIEIFD